MKRTAILFILLIFVSSFVYAQAGSLDKTFGDEGKTVISISRHHLVANDVAILPDGKIIQCGIMHNDEDSWVILTRYNSNGIVDSTYGKNGRCTNYFLWPAHYVKIAQYPDGRILAYGSSSYLTRQAYILRILPNGVLDSTFGQNGMYNENDFTVLTDLKSLVIRDDGKIVMAGGRGSNNGSNTFYRPTITMLTSDGHLDTLFGDKGRNIVTAATDTLSIVSADISDDGVITFGCSPQGLVNYDVCVIRCDMSGTVDTLFGDKGVVTVSLTDNPNSFIDMYVLESGQIYCLVNIRSENNTTGVHYHVAVLKFTADGKDEISFGDHGTAIVQKDDGEVYGHSFIIDSSSRIIVAGGSSVGLFNDTYATALRLNSNGSPDSTFGTYGMSGVLPAFSGEGNSVAVQKDGKYVVAGCVRRFSSNNADNLIFRLNNTGTSNVSPKSLSVNAPISIHPTPSTGNCTVTYTLPNSSDCSFTLRDESGRKVRTFMKSEYRTAGKHEDELDLRGLASGVYFLSLEYNGKTETAKVVVM